MATIIQRGEKWQAKVRKKGHGTVSKTFVRRADAEAWARKTESELERGLWRDTTEAERTTLGEALVRYEREVTANKKGAGIERYRIAKWREHALAKRSLASVRGQDLASWRDQMLAAGYAPATVRLEFALISALYEHARKDWGIPIENPARGVRMPSVNNARNRRLDADEEAHLMTALGMSRNPWIKPLVQFALETAMRRGELLSLTWENVDLKRRVAHLPETKNGEARNVPLSSKAVAILEGLPRSLDGRVFPVSANALKLAWVRATKRAGLEDLHFHDLRHEATSRLAEKLPNVVELSAVTGHKDLRMLKRYYHPRAEDLARKLG